MLFAQVSHALSLNDVCDTLRNHSSMLLTIRGATPPSRNGLSHANKVRDSAVARGIFYETLSHLTSRFPLFGRFDSQFELSRRMRRTINIVDSTTISLFAYCMDWAKHRRRKAAAKCHMLLNANSFLPRFAVIKTAKSSDAVMARVLCAPTKTLDLGVGNPPSFPEGAESIFACLLWFRRTICRSSSLIIYHTGVHCCRFGVAPERSRQPRPPSRHTAGASIS
jgi:hypothetical protein